MGEFNSCPSGAHDRTALPSSYPSEVNASSLLSLDGSLYVADDLVCSPVFGEGQS